MVNIPDQLAWELVRHNSSFMKKVNGRTKRSGSIKFSTEPGNLRNLSLLKYSGLANAQTIDVTTASSSHRAQLVTKTAAKSGKCAAIRTQNVRGHFRQAVATLENQTTKVYYRPDLTQDMLAKYTKVYQANRRAKGITKPVPVKKGRGTHQKD